MMKVLRGRRQKHPEKSSGEKKRKKPDRNIGNRSKSEVLHEETVVLHKEAVRRQPRSPWGGSQSPWLDIQDLLLENYLPPRGDLDASSLPLCGELLSPYGELHFSTGFRWYDRESCVFLFPGGLVRMFSSSSAQHFHHFLDCSPWTNLSWWFRRYGRNSLPMLRSDFVIHENLLWCFVFIVFVICLVTVRPS